MKEFKGTKGDWAIKDKPFFVEYSNVWKVAVYSDNLRFCQYIAGRTEEEALANAQLIAAAPELLEALIELVIINQQRLDGAGSWSCSKLWFRKTWNATERAVKAIKKALGL